jgi:glycosyltransferase involved in cell wall biosynthesis
MHPGDSNVVAKSDPGKDDVVALNLRQPWIPAAPVKATVAFLVYLIPTLWRLHRFMREKQIQLVSLEYPMPFMLYFFVLRTWTRIPILIGLHGSDVLLLHNTDLVWQWIVRRMMRRADWMLAHSFSLLQDAHERVGSLGANCSYLHCGVECRRLRETAQAATDVAPIPKGDYVLTVAKLYPRKGLDVLLRAIHDLKSSHGTYRFVIVGDGPEEARLKSMAMELGIESMVHFAGDVKSNIVPALFKHCAFFALSSRVEPFGIVLLEAMTFGKAIVATRAGGIPEFVEHGHNGLLVPVEDSHALAEGIDKLIRDKDLRERIGRNGRMVVEDQYDYDKLVMKYEELFKDQIRRANVC